MLQALPTGQTPGGMPSMDMPILSIDGETRLQTTESAPTDSVDIAALAARNAEILAKATASYDALRKLRFDGADETTFYAQVIATHDANMQVLNAKGIAEEDLAKARAVLADVRPEVLEGAVYHSKQNAKEKMSRLASAYIDLLVHPAMEGTTLRTDNRMLPTLAYIAASSAYNSKNYLDAIKYFDAYLATPDDSKRENIYMFYGSACIYAKEFDKGISAMTEGNVLYPTNADILKFGIRCCIDGKRSEMLRPFLDKALVQNPNDEQLLMIQGQLCEDNEEYDKALEVFHQLKERNPESMQIAQHLALCYFNIGVKHYNEAITLQSEKEAKQRKRQSDSFFHEAINQMEVIVANDRQNIKFLRALATSYASVGDTQNLETINTRLRALGHDAVNIMDGPDLIAYNADGSANLGSSANAGNSKSIPSFNEFSGEFVKKEIRKWSEKGQFEKMSAYQARLTPENIQAEYERLAEKAEAAYMETYSSKLQLRDLKLEPYDADNETFLINTSYGQIALSVPLKNNEAKLFAEGWSRVKFRKPRFIIRDDRPVIGSVTFETPNGKKYSYDAADAKDYTFTRPVIDFNGILAAVTKDNGRDNAVASNRISTAATHTITLESDVDLEIPLVKRPNNNTVALIISNENYHSVSAVASSLHDGKVMAEYCAKTLGIPKQNIFHYENALQSKMNSALANLRSVVNSMAQDKEVNVLVYYAGHGIPHEGTKEAYLLPVDAEATTPATWFSLNQFYKELNQMNAANVMVFLDACFSGAQRGDGMLADARGVVMKPKKSAPQGNMFVLSATSGEETAMPYKEKNHGMFTYHLLKKLKETKGNVTLAELSEYVIKEVKDQSQRVNQKQQTPTVTTSGTMTERAKSIKLR